MRNVLEGLNNVIFKYLQIILAQLKLGISEEKIYGFLTILSYQHGLYWFELFSLS